MSGLDNMRLYDIATRLQLYTEGVKVDQGRQFNYVLLKVREEFKKLLNRVKYRTLDGLTKAELNSLIVSLHKSQSNIYSEYQEQIIKQLKDFMAASMEVNRRTMATAFVEDDDEEQEPLTDDEAIAVMQEQNKSNHFIPLFGIAAATGDNKRMWTAIQNTPIPANGLYVLPFLKGFTASAQASVENIVRKAWANGWTVEETIAEVAGNDSRQGTANQMQRIQVQATAVLATAIQHVAAMTAAAVGSTLFGRYRWYSVIDSGTTDICRSRNMRIYTYGEGPLPPAHIRCRSHTAPYVGNDPNDTQQETLYAWLRRQTKDIQDDALGAKNAAAFRKGDIKAEDLSKYETSASLTIAEFAEKVAAILSR